MLDRKASSFESNVKNINDNNSGIVRTKSSSIASTNTESEALPSPTVVIIGVEEHFNA